MKNIMVVDRSQDYFFDIHSVSDEDFLRIFPGAEQSIEFNDDLYGRSDIDTLNDVFQRMWHARISNKNVEGINGILFYEDYDRKPFYKEKRDFSGNDNVKFSSKNQFKTVIIFDCVPSKSVIACLASDQLFDTIFPQPEQDVEFLEDLEQRVGSEGVTRVLQELSDNIIPKSLISGIDGVVYIDAKGNKQYFVTKIDADIPRHYPLSN